MLGGCVILGVSIFLAGRVTAPVVTCPNADVTLQKWDEEDTWGGTIPKEGVDVLISSGMKVVLNVSPPPLDTITIEEGGELVWGDVEDLTLKVSHIVVNGTFAIGDESADCRFTKKAHIILTGLSNSSLVDDSFGRKFIGVGENGSVEFHGGIKKSWTKLIQTVPAAKTTCGVIYNHQTEAFSSEYVKGLHAMVFNLDGSVFDFQLFYTSSSSPGDAFDNFQSFLAGIPVDKIVSVFVHRNLGKEKYPDRDWEELYKAVEEVGGLNSGDSLLRTVVKDEAYAFITRTGNTAVTKEDMDTTETDELFVDVPENGLRFIIQDGKATDIFVLTKEVVNPVIQLLDDVTSWKKGDKIIVASTDFEWRQTEEFELLSCPLCATNEVKLNNPFKFMHYGDISHDVDERAEVALLTRDIVIEGELEDSCYSNTNDEAELCEFFGTDTFGGHFKMIKGFKAAHIEQVEFYHMGQQAVLGSYPIHFHMCDDVDVGYGAWVRSNSIHHSQARCLTIHGTDGLEVTDNVCYKHRGHGYFLEDSAEQRNVLDGNLGLGTEHGAHIPSDMSKDMCNDVVKPFCDSPSTFWITHPNNYIRNNVAAGSDKNGFQYSVAREPLGPSKERQLERKLVTRDSAMYTQIAEFKNNVAHSNKNRGLFIEGFLSAGGMEDGVEIPENGFFRGLSHKPRNPAIKAGELVVSLIENFLAYKNKQQNIWTRGGPILIDHATLADSPSGIAMSTGGGSTYSMVNNSMFIGETDNVGTPRVGLTRSYASWRLDSPIRGIEYFQGPVFLHDSFFDMYKHATIDGKFRPAAAIGFKGSNPYPSTTNSNAKGIKFGFCDVTEGNYVFDSVSGELPGFGNQDGSRQISFRDLDGSVTGVPETQVVKTGIRFITNPCCVHRESWNMEICPLRYAKVQYRGSGGVLTDKRNDYPIYMKRDDRPEETHSIKGKMGLPFLLIKEKSYTVYFNGTAPTTLDIDGHDFETGDFVRLGICYPTDVESLELSTRNVLPSTDPAVEVANIEELDASTNPKAFFRDKSLGLFFIKIATNATRTNGEKCPGGDCPRWTIVRTGGSDEQPNCDAYSGAYNKQEDVCSQNVDDCLPADETTCEVASSTGYGAPIDNSDTSSLEFDVPCPEEPVLENGRSNPEYKGCFKDDRTYRDLAEETQYLYRSMTTDVCIERCYSRGYEYAAVQYGRECRCGDYYGVYGEDSQGCTKPCTGDSMTMCGGSRRNSVFSTGKAPGASLSTCGVDLKGSVVDGECLYVSDDKLNYWDAQKACVNMGGNLAAISTKQKQDEIIKYIRPTASDVWFGLTDAGREGVLTFVDGTAETDFNYFDTRWSNSDSYDYAYLYVRTLFHWRLSRGTYSKHYLCSIPMVDAGSTIESCGTSGYGNRFSGSDKCYLVINDKQRYHDAAHECWLRNGIPAPAEHVEDVVKHIQMFGLSNVDYYIGDGGYFEGLYFELVYSQLYNLSETTYWTNNGIVCLLETVSAAQPCSSGWTQLETSCYLFQGQVKKFDDANSMCRLGTSKLIIVMSEEENNFVGDLVKNFQSGRFPYVAMGIVYTPSVSEFRKLDGFPLTYSNWGSGQGDSNYEKGECAYFSPRYDGYYWYNRACASLYTAVVCKQPAAT